MTQRARWHLAWLVLAVCFVDLFINYSVRLGYGVVLPEMIRELGLGRTAGGSIYNAYLLVYILVTPFTGYLADRFGARPVIALCLLLLAFGVTAMGAAGSLRGASLAFALAGLGASGLWTPVIALVQRWFAHQRRGLALGVLSTGYGLGMATVGAVFPWLAANYSWRHTWYLLGAMALIMAAVSGALLRSEPAAVGLAPWGEGASAGGGTATPAPAAGRRPPLSRLFADRRFWLIGCSYFAIAYCLYGVTTFMVDYARYQLQLPLAQASHLATVHGVMQVVGVLVVLPLSDYAGRKRTILASNACITAALAAVLLAGGSWQLLYAAIGFMAVFYGATFPIYGALAGDFFPREVMGTVIGAWTPFYGCGAILTHWVTGLLRDATGRYELGFAICTAAAVAALGLMALVRTSPAAPEARGGAAGAGGRQQVSG